MEDDIAPLQEIERVDEDQLGEVLMVLDDESPDGLLRVFDLFRAGVPDRFRDIEAALADGRYEDAARASHSLRGSAGAFGAKRLSGMGERLEELCRRSDGPEARRIVEYMRTEFVAFRDILDRRVADVTENRP
jgi:HPt (histidine-containing phosphotransfer) domain-containing protein